jgi:hypothetical protein
VPPGAAARWEEDVVEDELHVDELVLHAVEDTKDGRPVAVHTVGHLSLSGATTAQLVLVLVRNKVLWVVHVTELVIVLNFHSMQEQTNLFSSSPLVSWMRMRQSWMRMGQRTTGESSRQGMDKENLHSSLEFPALFLCEFCPFAGSGGQESRAAFQALMLHRRHVCFLAGQAQVGPVRRRNFCFSEFHCTSPTWQDSAV